MHTALILLCLLVQTGAPAPQAATCQLDARLPDLAGQPYRVQIEPDLASDWQGRTVAEGLVDDDGRLRLELPADAGQPTLLSVGPGFRRLWLVPGALHVEGGERWSFDGDGAAENRVLEATGLNQPSVSTATPPAFDPLRFGRDVQARASARRAQLAELLPDAEAGFRGYVLAEIAGAAATERALYPVLSGLQGLVDSAAIPDTATAFWDDFELHDDRAALVSPRYREALAGLFEHRAAQRLRAERRDPLAERGAWMLATLELQRSALAERPASAELLEASRIAFMIQYLEPGVTATALEGFVRAYPRSTHIGLLTGRFADAVGLDVRALAERVRFVDRDGASHRLDELAGRLVYVDLWGSWCVACLLLTPDLQRLARELPAEVTLLGLNMKDSAQAWRQALDDKQLPGTQWKPATPADEALLTELIQLRAYPRFLLLGREGQLLSHAAPPPGEVGPLLEASLRR